jgi:hypothetical protein
MSLTLEELRIAASAKHCAEFTECWRYEGYD